MFTTIEWNTFTLRLGLEGLLQLVHIHMSHIAHYSWRNMTYAYLRCVILLYLR